MTPVTGLVGGGDAAGAQAVTTTYLSSLPLRAEANYNYNAFGGVTPMLYQTMQANGDGTKKIWGTEMGAPTPWQGMTYEYLAAYIREAYSAWASWAYTGPLIWFNYHDPGTNPSLLDDHYGIVHNDYTPKGSAVSTITEMLGG